MYMRMVFSSLCLFISSQSYALDPFKVASDANRIVERDIRVMTSETLKDAIDGAHAGKPLGTIKLADVRTGFKQMWQTLSTSWIWGFGHQLPEVPSRELFRKIENILHSPHLFDRVIMRELEALSSDGKTIQKPSPREIKRLESRLAEAILERLRKNAGATFWNSVVDYVRPINPLGKKEVSQISAIIRKSRPVAVALGTVAVVGAVVADGASAAPAQEPDASVYSGFSTKGPDDASPFGELAIQRALGAH